MDAVVRQIGHDEVVLWLRKKHYARRIPSITIAFGLFADGILNGVCTFGMPPNNQIPISVCGPEYRYCVLEFNRLCLQEPHERNAASWFLSECFRMLPKPKILVSYADIGQGHIGYVYQATNWIYTGETKPDAVYRDTRTGKVYHGKSVFNKYGTKVQSRLPQFLARENEPSGKHRYIMFLGSKKEKKAMLKALRWPVLPYPKGESRRYDASYKPITQMVMF